MGVDTLSPMSCLVCVCVRAQLSSHLCACVLAAEARTIVG